MESFTRDGLTFDVRDSGPADGPVVVLLHGFPQSAAEWDAIVPRLTAQGYRCLVPDQRGYSPGARPRSRRAYRANELTQDVLALVDAAGADSVHVVGHDWGAAVAWALAINVPGRVRTLNALSVPHPAAFLGALATSRQFLESWYMYAFQLPWLPERAFAGPGGRQRFERFMVRGGQTPERAARDADLMIDGGALTTAVNWYRAIPFTQPSSTRRPVTVPTLFLWSDGDHFITRNAAERCRAWVTGPYRFETLPGVSHWIPEEAPERTSDLLLEHFAAPAPG